MVIPSYLLASPSPIQKQTHQRKNRDLTVYLHSFCLFGFWLFSFFVFCFICFFLFYLFFLFFQKNYFYYVPKQKIKNGYSLLSVILLASPSPIQKQTHQRKNRDLTVYLHSFCLFGFWLF